MSNDNAHETLSQIIFGYIPARAVQAAAELGLADHIAQGHDTAESLAAAVGANPNRLDRLMRYLIGLGVFGRGSGGYTLTAMGELLRSGVPDGQRPAAVLSAHLFPAWGEIQHVLRTEEAGYDKFYGRPLFEGIAADPDLAATFDDAMTAIHGGETDAMLDAYDFTGIQRLMDVGGGNGSLLAATLARYPTMSGMLFDLAHVVERSASALQAAGVADRCDVVSGDFFEALPGGADAILMRHIIHDWPDDKATVILRNAAQAVSPGGRVLVIEMVVPEDDKPSPAKSFDMAMMVFLAGAERTPAEYKAMFENAGLARTSITPTASPVSVVEGRRL